MMRHEKMETKSHSEPIEFMLPKGVEIPDDMSKPFDIVVTLEPKGGREVCIVKIGDVDAPGYEDGKRKSEYRKEDKPSYADYADSIASETSPEFGAEARSGGGSY